MKKSLVFLGLLVVMLGLFINSKISYQNDLPISDNELVEMYLMEERGDGNYDIFIQDGTDKDGIYYLAYDDGKFCDCGYIDRDYCESVALQ